MTLDIGLIKITNDNGPIKMAKVAKDKNRDAEIYFQLPMQTQYLGWSQLIPKATDVGPSGTKPVQEVIELNDDASDEEFQEYEYHVSYEVQNDFFVISCGGGKQFEFLLDDFDLMPYSRRRSSGVVITELEEEQSARIENSGATRVENIEAARVDEVDNSRVARDDRVENLGVASE